MRFTKFKNNSGDLVDDVVDLVMHGSQVSLANISSINVMSTNDYNTRSGVSKIDKPAKYSLAKRDGKDELYGYNAHYGWNKLSPEALGYFLLSRYRR